MTAEASTVLRLRKANGCCKRYYDGELLQPTSNEALTHTHTPPHIRVQYSHTFSHYCPLFYSFVQSIRTGLGMELVSFSQAWLHVRSSFGSPSSLSNAFRQMWARAYRAYRVCPGLDEILPEALKWGGDERTNIMWRLVKKIWEEEQTPRDWSKAVIVPIHKKGDRRDSDNYRGIALLSIPGKVVTRLVNLRLQKLLEAQVMEEQCGFRKGRGTVDQMFTARQTLEKVEEAARSGENLMPRMIAAVESYATLGEIADSLRKVFGEYQEAI